MVISCDEDASEIGSDFFDGGSLIMSAVDTITLKVSTVKFDSIPTSDATRLLIGYHEDQDLGIMSAVPHFEISPNYAFSIDEAYTQYSRAELRLTQDQYSFYDTAQTVTFSVHQLTQSMDPFPGSGSTYLYSTSKRTYDPTPMGTVTFKPRPNSKDTVIVSLTEAFGRDIISLAQNAAPEVATTTEFIHHFKGLVLIPSAVSGPIIGLSTTAEVRVYYTDKSVTPTVERKLVLSTNSNLKFNQINSDRTGKKVDALTTQRYSLGSTATDHKSYIQCGTSMGLRVSVPYLRDILIDNPGLTVVNALLKFYPTRDSRGTNVTMPTNLTMTAVDFQNTLYETLSQTALLYPDYYLDRDTRYEVDITTYVKSQLATEAFNDNALIFTPDDATLRNTLDRLYLGDQFSERPMTLTLTCLTYQKE